MQLEITVQVLFLIIATSQLQLICTFCGNISTNQPTYEQTL
jgi:hypothetical protein